MALDLYFRVPYKEMSPKHPEIQALSKLLIDLPIHEVRPTASDFRNGNSVYMKLGNFLRFDQKYKGVGLKSGSKSDMEVWHEFASDQARLTAVAAAIRATNVHRTVGTPTPVPDEEEEFAPEGRLLLREHKMRERSASLVQKKKAAAWKQFGELACEVCDFVFSKQYGDRAEKFIECHQTIPISELRPGQITQLRDLALVCANCHRMLHIGGELLTIPAMRASLRQTFANTAIGKG